MTIMNRIKYTPTLAYYLVSKSYKEKKYLWMVPVQESKYQHTKKLMFRFS